MKVQKTKKVKKLRRAFVSLPPRVWDVIDADYKDKIGTGDSEVIRVIVMMYLSEKGYFLNEKDFETIEEVRSKLDVMENMVGAMLDILAEKGQISYGEWQSRIETRLSELAHGAPRAKTESSNTKQKQ